MNDGLFVSETAKREIRSILNYIYGRETDIDGTSPGMAADLALGVMKGHCNGTLESAVNLLHAKHYDLNYGE